MRPKNMEGSKRKNRVANKADKRARGGGFAGSGISRMLRSIGSDVTGCKNEQIKGGVERVKMQERMCTDSEA